MERASFLRSLPFLTDVSQCFNSNDSSSSSRLQSRSQNSKQNAQNQNEVKESSSLVNDSTTSKTNPPSTSARANKGVVGGVRSRASTIGAVVGGGITITPQTTKYITALLPSVVCNTDEVLGVCSIEGVLDCSSSVDGVGEGESGSGGRKDLVGSGGEGSKNVRHKSSSSSSSATTQKPTKTSNPILFAQPHTSTSNEIENENENYDDITNGDIGMSPIEIFILNRSKLCRKVDSYYKGKSLSSNAMPSSGSGVVTLQHGTTPTSTSSAAKKPINANISHSQQSNISTCTSASSLPSPCTSNSQTSPKDSSSLTTPPLANGKGKNSSNGSGSSGMDDNLILVKLVNNQTLLLDPSHVTSITIHPSSSSSSSSSTANSTNSTNQKQIRNPPSLKLNFPSISLRIFYINAAASNSSVEDDHNADSFGRVGMSDFERLNVLRGKLLSVTGGSGSGEFDDVFVYGVGVGSKNSQKNAHNSTKTQTNTQKQKQKQNTNEYVRPDLNELKHLLDLAYRIPLHVISGSKYSKEDGGQVEDGVFGVGEVGRLGADCDDDDDDDGDDNDYYMDVDNDTTNSIRIATYNSSNKNTNIETNQHHYQPYVQKIIQSTIQKTPALKTRYNAQSKLSSLVNQLTYTIEHKRVSTASASASASIVDSSGSGDSVGKDGVSGKDKKEEIDVINNIVYNVGQECDRYTSSFDVFDYDYKFNTDDNTNSNANANSNADTDIKRNEEEILKSKINTLFNSLYPTTTNKSNKRKHASNNLSSSPKSTTSVSSTSSCTSNGGGGGKKFKFDGGASSSSVCGSPNNRNANANANANVNANDDDGSNDGNEVKLTNEQKLDQAISEMLGNFVQGFLS